jgi:hypothetical protein
MEETSLPYDSCIYKIKSFCTLASQGLGDIVGAHVENFECVLLLCSATCELFFYTTGLQIHQLCFAVPALIVGIIAGTCAVCEDFF